MPKLRADSGLPTNNASYAFTWTGGIRVGLGNMPATSYYTLEIALRVQPIATRFDLTGFLLVQMLPRLAFLSRAEFDVSRTLRQCRILASSPLRLH
jgi:hypothetical protein